MKNILKSKWFIVIAYIVILVLLNAISGQLLYLALGAGASFLCFYLFEQIAYF
ncbi:MAG: hypothetical protein GX206_11790 [Clostridiales bacterium]|nr:hypothetical protein [Clostridiales bacterium]